MAHHEQDDCCGGGGPPQQGDMSSSSTLEETETTTHQDDDDDDDDEVIFRMVVDRSVRAKRALCALGALAAAMALHSLLLAHQFFGVTTDADISRSSNNTTTTMMIPEHRFDDASFGSVCKAPAEMMNQMASSWQSVLQHEQLVLTNLIHAALLAATALLVYCGGRENKAAVWMCFTRNCALYWSAVSVLYVVVDLVDAAGQQLSSSSRLLVTSSFGLLSLVAFYYTQAELDDLKLRQQPSYNRVLYACSHLIAAAALSNFCVTTYFWFQQQDCNDNSNSTSIGDNSNNNVLPFVMTHSEQAHACFLLALVQLAALLTDPCA